MCIRASALLLVVSTSIASASPGAAAFAPVPDFENKTFVLTGASLGAAFDHGTGFLGGGEISVAHFGTAAWYGGYADVLYDTQHERLQLGVGGEAGLSVIGLDAGIVVEPTRPALDLRIRGALTVGVISFCLGPVIPLTQRDRDSWIELSVLLKWPLPSHDG